MSNPARTGTQKALHVVSIIMIVLGVLVILSGASLIALGVSAATMGMDQPMTLGDTETTADTTSVALGIIVLAMGLVQLVVAAFGLRGSKDASKIGPFRILIWGISLVILATILYGWFFNGNWYIQNSPLLLIGNVIYLLVCSTLADAVKREHDLGIVGEAKAEVERSGSQKALLSSAPARGWPTTSCARAAASRRKRERPRCPCTGFRACCRSCQKSNCNKKYMRSREKGRGDGRNDKAGEGRASLAAGDYVGGNADPLGSPSGLGR